MARTIEVKDAGGNIIATAGIDDGVNITRLLGRLDRRRAQRSKLAILLRNHMVTARTSDAVTCKCGEVTPDGAHWAVHVATVLIPET